MSLHARIAQTEAPAILWHQFQADILEWELGERTRGEIVSTHNITPEEESELDQLKAIYQRALDKAVFKASLDNAGLLLVSGLAYQTAAEFNQRLVRAADDWTPLRTYTLATLPPITADAEGHQIYVQDGAGGLPIIAFCDGAVWRRVDNRQAVG